MSWATLLAKPLAVVVWACSSNRSLQTKSKALDQGGLAPCIEEPKQEEAIVVWMPPEPEEAIVAWMPPRTTHAMAKRRTETNKVSAKKPTHIKKKPPLKKKSQKQ
jgi:hypothetical protein